MVQRLAPVPEDALEEIRKELEAKPIPHNLHRKNSGPGRSGTFGFVNRRGLEPDISRLCWRRPRLYHLLLDFGRRYVPFSDWTSIQVNMNYQTAAHRDVGNEGDSYIIGFGAYQEGQLVVSGEEIDIRYQPVLFNGSQEEHSTKPFIGSRYSIVYFRMTRKPSKTIDQYTPIELPSGWALEYTDLEGKSTILKGNKGLAHPLAGRKKK
jgi:hypothetical protein